MLVRLEGAGLTIGRVPILTDISLGLAEGSCHALVGPNGSGKTSLMRLALGLVRPTTGRVHRSAVVRVGRSGAVFGPRLLNPARNARTELILRVLGAGGSRAQAEQAWADAALPNARARCGALSLGQAHRLVLSAAFATRPRLLVLDEPTVGLDAMAVQWLRDWLTRYVAEGGCAWISSHDLDEIERIADVVTVIREGRILRTARIEDLVGGPPATVVRSSDPAALRGALAAAGIPSDVQGPDTVVRACSTDELGAVLARARVPLTRLTERHGDLAAVVAGWVAGDEPPDRRAHPPEAGADDAAPEAVLLGSSR